MCKVQNMTYTKIRKVSHSCITRVPDKGQADNIAEKKEIMNWTLKKNFTQACHFEKVI